MRKFKNTIALLFLAFICNIGIKAQTFNCFITNDTLLSPNVYQFDIYLDVTVGEMYFRTLRVGIQFDTTFFPAGATITGAVVPGSSQVVYYANATPSINQTYSCLTVNPNLGAFCSGLPANSNSTHFQQGMGPRRISSYQIISSLPFNNVSPKPSMIRPTDTVPDPTISRMQVTAWSQTCVAQQISNSGIYTHFPSNTLINQIHNIGLYVPVLPNVTGQVYYDGNANCVLDTFEMPLNNINVSCQPAGNYANTYYDGKYYFLLPDGSYQFQCGIPRNWMLTCADSSTIVTNGVASNNCNFGLTRIPGLNDLAISFGHAPVRANRDINVHINYKNYGSTTLDGTVRFDFDTSFTFVSSTITPDTIQTNSLSWNFTNLIPDENRQIILTLHSGMYPTNTPFSNSAYIWSSAVDVYLNDNSRTFSSVFSGSFDPNEKYVEPKGLGSNGAITPSDTLLNYQIVFQNTGNDTAFYISIVDTLDENLDPLTLHIGTVSMPYSYTLSSTGILRFIFDPCALVDSTTDEPNSHGFINYSIETRPGLLNGTVIENEAYIYFDYNLPIKTNTTINTIDYFLSSKNIDSNNGIIKIYPNPTDGYLRFELIDNKFKEGTAIIIDNTGRVLHKELIQKSSGEINLDNYSGGIYTFILNMDNFSARNKIVVY